MEEEALLPNTTLSQYRIVSKIGEGGMGRVYLAHDTRLGRKVALKILPAELAANQDRMRRFVLEAKAAAALNHPNIAHIYEIGESDGVNFIAMEFIDGVTLRAKIHQEHTDLRKLLRFLQHAAEGLAKAHAAGIVHRDLKPDNIMINRDGHAKILDFGLAKLIEQQPLPGRDSSEVATAVMPQHSTPGSIMGTVGYMSPEQAQGKTKEVDQRSDIFSFGCVLFEAATGKKPFEGDSIVKSLHMVIYEPAPLLADLNPGAPPELQRIVRRCLAKDPDDRYQSIKEVAIELKELRRELESGGIDTTVPPSPRNQTAGGAAFETNGAQSNGAALSAPSSSLSTRAPSEYLVGTLQRHKLAALVVLIILIAGGVGTALYLRSHTSASTTIKSIAVMPFINGGNNADIEYLSDGMTETLINTLSQLPDLSVKARSSVFRYKGKEIDPQTVGTELNVQAIVNGRIIQHGDDLTLYLSLVDARTGNQLWGEQYSRKQADLLSLQNAVARDVATRLRNKLSGADEQKVARNYTQNTEAYQLYLQGRFFANKRTPESIRKAIGYYQQAIDKDPNYALGYAGLSDGYGQLGYYASDPAPESLIKAREAALRALSLDNNLAEGHSALGFVLTTADFDYAGGEREYKRAIELDPNYEPSHHNLGVMLFRIGRQAEGMAELRRALELEPFSLVVNRLYGEVLVYSGRYDEGLAQLKKTAEMDPTFTSTYSALATAYRLMGNYAESVESYAKLQELNGRPQTAAFARASFAAGGWQGFLRDMTSRRPEGVSPSMAAIFFAQLGEKDKAFAELNKAVENREYTVRFLKIEPGFDPLRYDPRFKELLKRMKFPV
ncbi:MAG TPA: protein kinase [Pyrinomonadaceae bacterium]|nr:protein kinase [Pyrinomonadaceae bacterium]